MRRAAALSEDCCVLQDHLRTSALPFVVRVAYRVIARELHAPGCDECLLPLCLFADLVWWQEVEDLQKKFKGELPQSGQVGGWVAPVQRGDSAVRPGGWVGGPSSRGSSPSPARWVGGWPQFKGELQQSGLVSAASLSKQDPKGHHPLAALLCFDLAP